VVSRAGGDRGQCVQAAVLPEGSEVLRTEVHRTQVALPQRSQPWVVVHTCNLSPQEAEARGLSPT
jgi:hypothetical protein